MSCKYINMFKYIRSFKIRNIMCMSLAITILPPYRMCARISVSFCNKIKLDDEAGCYSPNQLQPTETVIRCSFAFVPAHCEQQLIVFRAYITLVYSWQGGVEARSPLRERSARSGGMLEMHPGLTSGSGSRVAVTCSLARRIVGRPSRLFLVGNDGRITQTHISDGLVSQSENCGHTFPFSLLFTQR